MTNVSLHGIYCMCELCMESNTSKRSKLFGYTEASDVAKPVPASQQPLDIHKPMRVKSSKQPVRVVCVDSVTSKIIMAISRSEGGEYLAFASEIHTHFENVPEKRKGWINLYKSAFNNHVAAVSHAYDTKAVADANKDKLGERIACIEIEWTE